MRVCSHDHSHDLSEAENWSHVCPICGYALVDIPDSPPPPPPPPPEIPPELTIAPLVEREETPQGEPASETKLGPDARGEAIPPEPPSLPALVLICAKTPSHDIGNHDAGATLCPQPNCGGRLIQIECGRFPDHDLSNRAADARACPICGHEVLAPVCTNVAGHSMAPAGARPTACPECGKPLRRAPYPWVTGITIEKTWLEIIQEGLLVAWRWLGAHLWAPAACVLALVAVAVWLLWPPHPPTPPGPNEQTGTMTLPGSMSPPTHDCSFAPERQSESIDAAVAEARTVTSADAALAKGNAYLKCGHPNAALLLLRKSVDLGDSDAAMTLGKLFDPIAAPAMTGKQTSDAKRALLWYRKAAKMNNPHAASAIEQLKSALRLRVSHGDDNAAQILNQAEQGEPP